ncbi:MAG: hypothetical protein LBS45_09655 [Synergistaceae bacterium]|jgi:hypothetical protein|nr:hypothetical protein [Synergistaceae bacterium]
MSITRSLEWKKVVEQVIRNISDGDRRIWNLANGIGNLANVITVYEARRLAAWAEGGDLSDAKSIAALWRRNALHEKSGGKVRN